MHFQQRGNKTGFVLKKAWSAVTLDGKRAIICRQQERQGQEDGR
jgi:hypothetical protein